MTKIFIVYYSMYGHVKTMAEEVKKGVDSVEGVEAELFQVSILKLLLMLSIFTGLGFEAAGCSCADTTALQFTIDFPPCLTCNLLLV